MAKPNKNRLEYRQLRPDTLPRELRCDLENCPSNRHGDHGQYLLSLRSSEGPCELEAHCRSCGASFRFKLDLPRRYYTRDQVAELLGCTKSTIDRRVKDGELRARKLGKAKNSPVRFEPAEILRYLESLRQTGPVAESSLPGPEGSTVTESCQTHEAEFYQRGEAAKTPETATEDEDDDGRRASNTDAA